MLETYDSDLGDVPGRHCWVFHLRHVWDVEETYWWDVFLTSSWDVITTFQKDVVKNTYHWDVLVRRCWCFIWDIPATSLGCTKRICKCSLFHHLTLIERYVFLFLYGIHINQFCLMIMQIFLLFSINILFQFFIYYLFINCHDSVLYSF